MRNILDDKRGKTSPAIVVGVIAMVLIAVGLFYFGYSQSTTQEQIVDEKGVVCDSSTTPSLKISAFDKENKGTALTEGTNLYRIKGENTWSTFTAGTGFDVSALEDYEVVMGVSTSDFTDNAYGKSFEVNVPCEENPSIEREMVNDEVESSLTTTFYDTDDNAGGEDFVAGQTQDVSIKLQAGTDNYFGNPFLPDETPNVLCLALNSTAWDIPEKVYMEDGTELSSVGTPIRHNATASKKDYCYELPVIDDSSKKVYLKLNADDSIAPAVDDTGYIYPGNWFINSDTGELSYGVEDQDGTAVGTDTPDTVTLDFTA